MQRAGGSYVINENGEPVLQARTDAAVTAAKQPPKETTPEEVTTNEDTQESDTRED